MPNNNDDRVLSYRRARQLTKPELDTIAGAFDTTGTFAVTHTSPENSDLIHDE